MGRIVCPEVTEGVSAKDRREWPEEVSTAIGPAGWPLEGERGGRGTVGLQPGSQTLARPQAGFLGLRVGAECQTWCGEVSLLLLQLTAVTSLYLDIYSGESPA